MCDVRAANMFPVGIVLTQNDEDICVDVEINVGHGLNMTYV